MGLKDIIKNNHYPIVFVGSGMSKRYLENSPDWNSLLQEYWDMLNTGIEYYTHLHDLRNQIIEQADKDGNKIDSDELDFSVKTKVATEIEKEFDDQFFHEKIPVKGLNLKKAYEESISPFRFHLSQRFSNYKLAKNIDKEEFELFQKVLRKSRIIVTTNYDTLIEDSIRRGKQNPKLYIGNAGFFDDSSMGWSEIYKIHGSVTDPSSIVITEDDYKRYDQNSILVTAKIMSSMVDSPILFLGYSMTDRNVVKMLNDFSTQLPQEALSKSANRILIVDRDEGINTLQEAQMVSTKNGKNFSYTLIKTDNYKSLFDQLQSIDEGVSPYEVRRFENIVKKIVVSKGQRQALDAYLVSPKNLDELDKKIDSGEKIVVALGDTKNIFVTPTTVNYFKDYISERFEILPQNALRFIAAQQNGRFPMLHHFNNININEVPLEGYEKDRIKAKIDNDESSIKEIQDTINSSNQIKFNSLDAILNSNMKLAKKLDCITFNITRLNFEKVEDLIKHQYLDDFCKLYKSREPNRGLEKTAYRKLFVAWDVMKYKK